MSALSPMATEKVDIARGKLGPLRTGSGHALEKVPCPGEAIAGVLIEAVPAAIFPA